MFWLIDAAMVHLSLGSVLVMYRRSINIKDNKIISFLLSLVRTKSVGHLRDIRRFIVAVSRARLGLYVFWRTSLFSRCHDLHIIMDQFRNRPHKLQLIIGETYPTIRTMKEILTPPLFTKLMMSFTWVLW